MGSVTKFRMWGAPGRMLMGECLGGHPRSEHMQEPCLQQRWKYFPLMVAPAALERGRHWKWRVGDRLQSGCMIWQLQAEVRQLF